MTNTIAKPRSNFRTPFLKYTPDNLEFILLLVAKFSKVTVDDLKGRSRKEEVTIPRQTYCYLAFRFTENSAKNIGKHIGGRNHKSVFWGIQSIKNLSDTRFDVVINLLLKSEAELSKILTPVKRKCACYTQGKKSAVKDGKNLVTI